MPRLTQGFGARNIFIIVVLAIILVYFWGTFTTTGMGTCTKTDVEKDRYGCTSVGQKYDKTEFVVPEKPELEKFTLWVLKLIIVSVAVFFAYAIQSKFIGRNPSRRDMATIIVMIIAVFLTWTYLIEP